MDIGNLLVGFSLLQAVLFGLFLIGTKKLSFPKWPLLLLLLALAYFQLEFLLVRNAIGFSFKNLLLTHHGGWLLVGPLIMAYAHSFRQVFSWKSLGLHLLPFLVISIVIPLLFSETIPKRGLDTACSPYSNIQIWALPK